MKIGLGPIRPVSLLITAASVTGHMRWTTPRWSVASIGVCAANALFQQVLGVVRRVGVQAKDLAQVRLRGPREQQPVLLGAGHRLFVRVDVALAEPLQPAAAHEPAARVLAAGVAEDLVIDVDGRLRLLGQHAFLPPVLEEARGARVAVVLVVVARLLAVELQADEVGRVLLVELVLKLGVDHVIRRADDVRQRADVLEVVANAAEGLDVGHGGVVSGRWSVAAAMFHVKHPRGASCRGLLTPHAVRPSASHPETSVGSGSVGAANCG